MGMKRGSFEAVQLSSAVARAVEHSTIRPDEGTPLRIGAKALDAWADAFGMMARKRDSNVATQLTCRDALGQAAKDYEDYKARPDNEQDATQLERLRLRAENASARYDASMKLGVFSWGLDMERDYGRDYGKGESK